MRFELLHRDRENAAARPDVQTTLPLDLQRLEELDAERRRLVRAGAEGLLLRDDQRVAARVRGDERGIRRDDEAVADEDRL